MGDADHGAEHAAEAVKEGDRNAKPVLREEVHAQADVVGVVDGNGSSPASAKGLIRAP